MKEAIARIKHLIVKPDLESAFYEAKELVLGDKNFEHTILMLEVRYRQHKNLLTKGMITADKQTEINSISNGLLEVLNDIGLEEEKEETTSLNQLNATLIQLTPVQKTKSKLFYKRFRTGELFELSVNLEMTTKELKDRLIRSVMPNYYKIPELREVFDFYIMDADGPRRLADHVSLSENGLKDQSTIQLRKYFTYGDDEE